MMKKSVIISIFLVLSLYNPLFSAQQSVQQLLTEFNRISNPQSPEYNERRVKEILATIENIAPTRAPQLEISYLRPLSARLENALAQAQTAESRLNLEIARLQGIQRQTEQQLRQSEELLRRQTAEMQQRQSEAAARQARLEQDINRLRIDYQTAQDTIAQQTTRSNAAQAELDQLRQDIAAIRATLQNAQDQLVQERQQHLNAQGLLQNQLDQSVRETHSLQADLAAAQNALSTAEANQTQERVQALKQLAQAVAQYQALEQDRNQLHTQYLATQQELAEQKAQNAAANQAQQTAIATRQTEIERLNEELATLTATLSAAQANVTRINQEKQTELAAAQNVRQQEQTQHAQELAQLRERLTQNSAQQTALQAELEQLRTAQAASQQALTDQAAALELERTQQRTALTLYDEQRTALEAQIAAATQENLNLKSQLQQMEDNARSQTTALQAQQTLASEQTQRLEQELAQLRTDYQTAQQRLAEQNSQSGTTEQTLHAQISELQKQLADAQAGIAGLDKIKEADATAAQTALQQAQDRHTQELAQLRAHFEETQRTAQEAHAQELAALRKQLQDERKMQQTAAEQTSEQLSTQTKQLQTLETAKAVELGQLQEQLRNTQSELAQALAASQQKPEPSAPPQQTELAAKDAQIAQLTQQVERLNQEVTTLKAQPRITPTGTALQTLLSGPSSSSQRPTSSSIAGPSHISTEIVDPRGLYQTFNLGKETPVNIRFGSDEYLLSAPKESKSKTKLDEKVLADLQENPSPADLQTFINQQEATALSERDNKSSSGPIDIGASYAGTSMADFDIMENPNIKEEGSCGENYAKNGTILLYAIHGTWSDNAAFAGDINTQSSYYIFKFACQLAEAKKQKVQIVSQTWTGDLAPSQRVIAARGLFSDCLGRITSQTRPSEIWMLAHSHGCNIASMAANLIHRMSKEGTSEEQSIAKSIKLPKNMLIDTAIFMGSPTLDYQLSLTPVAQATLDNTINTWADVIKPNKWFESAKNYIKSFIWDESFITSAETTEIPSSGFKTTYAFYTQGDFTQLAGSIESKKTTDRKVPYATPELLAQGQKIYNIRTLLEGYDMDHISIKWGILPHLAQLIAIIDGIYSCYFDLEANVSEDPNIMPLVAIRHYEPNCGSKDDRALAESVRAQEAFKATYQRAMSDIGVKHIPGAMWAFNLGREGTSLIRGEPAIGQGWLQKTDSPTSSRSSSPQPSSSSSSSSQ